MAVLPLKIWDSFSFFDRESYLVLKATALSRCFLIRVFSSSSAVPQTTPGTSRRERCLTIVPIGARYLAIRVSMQTPRETLLQLLGKLEVGVLLAMPLWLLCCWVARASTIKPRSFHCTDRSISPWSTADALLSL